MSDSDADYDAREVVQLSIENEKLRDALPNLLRLVSAWAQVDEAWVEHIVDQDEPCGCLIEQELGGIYCEFWKALDDLSAAKAALKVAEAKRAAAHNKIVEMGIDPRLLP